MLFLKRTCSSLIGVPSALRYILQSFELYLFADVQEPQTLLQPQNVGTYTNTFEMNRKTNTWNSHK